MAETHPLNPEEGLNELLKSLQSGDPAQRLDAIRQLTAINYSSETVRNELEKLAANDSDETIRREALATLDTPAQRNVRRHFNKVNQTSRRTILQEITEWEKLGLLETQKADSLRRRYDFDFKPAPAPKADTAPQAESTPEPGPAGTRPTLAQILLSESNIKIALYLRVTSRVSFLSDNNPAVRRSSRSWL